MQGEGAQVEVTEEEEVWTSFLILFILWTGKEQYLPIAQSKVDVHVHQQAVDGGGHEEEEPNAGVVVGLDHLHHPHWPLTFFPFINWRYEEARVALEEDRL